MITCLVTAIRLIVRDAANFTFNTGVANWLGQAGVIVDTPTEQSITLPDETVGIDLPRGRRGTGAGAFELYGLYLGELLTPTGPGLSQWDIVWELHDHLSSLLKKGTGSEHTHLKPKENARREVPVPLFQKAVRVLYRFTGESIIRTGIGDGVVIVPEPSTIVLLTLGLFNLALVESARRFNLRLDRGVEQPLRQNTFCWHDLNSGA